MIGRALGMLVIAMAFGAQGAIAQDVSAPPMQLAFFGFEPGSHIADLDQQVRELGGAGLRCTRSRVERRLLDCRGMVADPSAGQPLEVWVSAIDSLSSVLTISGPVTAAQLDDWRSAIERDYGKVGARVQGPQWMMQWIRSRQMLRLTWRVRDNQKVASVSLVDGPVLDGWRRGSR